MIKEIKGNVFNSKADVLIHGANCFNTMGSGVAKQIKLYYPGAWEVDQQTKKGDKNKLGEYTMWSGKHFKYDQNIFVINLYSQYKYGVDKIHADYDAIKHGLTEIVETFPVHTFCMPRIGAGFAGGDWSIIRNNIETIFEYNNVEVYYL